VNYDPHYFWSKDNFFGHSITSVHDLACQYGYNLINLNYNNAFLMPAELSPTKHLSAAEAYDAGYRKRKDRLEKFSTNVISEDLIHMGPEDALAEVQKRYKQYEGKYSASLSAYEAGPSS
ncbi:MAG: hypothetical protein AAGA45_06040, partial [Verrucomicrobiota bacterium]